MDDYLMNATLVQRVVWDENSASGFKIEFIPLEKIMLSEDYRLGYEVGYKAGIDAGRKAKE